MPDWRDDYLASLQEAERNSPVNKELVEACSHLADRVAALEAEKAAYAAQAAGPISSTKPPTTPRSKPSAATTTTTPTRTDPAATSDGTAQLRLDLAEALRGRGQAQSRLKAAEAELATLRSKTKVDSKRIGDLTAERNALAARLRDRNEELAGKNKLLKDVQDDNLTLNIQLDVIEQKVAKVQAENKELVDRWMKRMGHEADALNLQNESPNKTHR
ncbi:autophagy-related protein 16 [Xylariaceae sp. FL1651]|nr:autophagy-related protein 16 [Xylariaceae sp. FL1651]